MDLLSSLGSSSSSAPQQSFAAGAHPVVPEPMLGIAPSPVPSELHDDPFGSDVFAAAAAGPAPIHPIGDLAAWFRKLCINANGVLYEDPFIQVDAHTVV
jgi:hypothetical protein